MRQTARGALGGWKHMREDPDVSRLLSAMATNATDARLGALSRRRFLQAAGALGGVALGGSSLVAFLGACGGSTPTGASANTNATVTMAVCQEPDTLDPSASGLITVGTISH